MARYTSFSIYNIRENVISGELRKKIYISNFHKNENNRKTRGSIDKRFFPNESIWIDSIFNLIRKVIKCVILLE